MKILHIGNIANNAYLNAKLLNDSGVESHVLCYDYYHLMGCPEWEECLFDSSVLDHNRPDWFSLQLDYERPYWFAQGEISDCLEYLQAVNAGQTHRARRFWGKFAVQNRTVKESIFDAGVSKIG